MITSEEQNASIPQITIFNNLFLTRDLIRYTKEKKISLSISYKSTKKKHFTKSIEHSYIKHWKKQEFLTLLSPLLKSYTKIILQQ